jgi:CRP-like cAMP-binding protein
MVGKIAPEPRRRFDAAGGVGVGIRETVRLPYPKLGERRAGVAEGTKTGRLLFLIRGAVDVVKDGWHIARIDKPGAVFGDMAALRDQPHSADVVVFQTSTFFVVKDAASFPQH